MCVPDLNQLARKHHPDIDETRRAFFAVYDGFGGDQACRCHPGPLRPLSVRSSPQSSEWLLRHFHINLVMHKAFATDPQTALLETFPTTDEELLRLMVRATTLLLPPQASAALVTLLPPSPLHRA